MTSDYVDNWDALPDAVQEALASIITRFDEGADLLFDRRLNLSFEAAVKELSVPGIVALADGFRQLRQLLEERITVSDPTQGTLLFDGSLPITAYDLPLYTPCLYVSQLAQAMDEGNVRVWKESTATELVETLLTMARSVRPDIETARVLIAALHDLVYLYPNTRSRVEEAAHGTSHANTAQVASITTRMLSHR